MTTSNDDNDGKHYNHQLGHVMEVFGKGIHYPEKKIAEIKKRKKTKKQQREELKQILQNEYQKSNDVQSLSQEEMYELVSEWGGSNIGALVFAENVLAKASEVVPAMPDTMQDNVAVPLISKVASVTSGTKEKFNKKIKSKAKTAEFVFSSTFQVIKNSKMLIAGLGAAGVIHGQAAAIVNPVLGVIVAAGAWTAVGFSTYSLVQSMRGYYSDKYSLEKVLNLGEKLEKKIIKQENAVKKRLEDKEQMLLLSETLKAELQKKINHRAVNDEHNEKKLRKEISKIEVNIGKKEREIEKKLNKISELKKEQATINLHAITLAKVQVYNQKGYKLRTWRDDAQPIKKGRLYVKRVNDGADNISFAYKVMDPDGNLVEGSIDKKHIDPTSQALDLNADFKAKQLKSSLPDILAITSERKHTKEKRLPPDLEQKLFELTKDSLPEGYTLENFRESLKIKPDSFTTNLYKQLKKNQRDDVIDHAISTAGLTLIAIGATLMPIAPYTAHAAPFITAAAMVLTILGTVLVTGKSLITALVNRFAKLVHKREVYNNNILGEFIKRDAQGKPIDYPKLSNVFIDPHTSVKTPDDILKEKVKYRLAYEHSQEAILRVPHTPAEEQQKEKEFYASLIELRPKQRNKILDEAKKKAVNQQILANAMSSPLEKIDRKDKRLAHIPDHKRIIARQSRTAIRKKLTNPLVASYRAVKENISEKLSGKNDPQAEPHPSISSRGITRG